MIVCAKGLSSAYLPISALMINERVISAISDESSEVGVFGLTFTYSGHPVSAKVASEHWVPNPICLMIWNAPFHMHRLDRGCPLFVSGMF